MTEYYIKSLKIIHDKLNYDLINELEKYKDFIKIESKTTCLKDGCIFSVIVSKKGKNKKVNE